MKFFISFVLLLVLCSFKSSFEMAVIKGPASLAETSQDCSSGETTQNPEATNVRSEIPETDLLNDVDLPQPPTDRKNSLSPSSTSSSPKTRRCARAQIIGSSRDVTLSLARRDVNGRRKQQCENCRKTIMCQKYNKCKACKPFCENMETTGAATTIPDVETRMQRVAPENNIALGKINEENAKSDNPENNEILEDINEEEANTEQTITTKTELILGSRFHDSSEEENVSRPRYYTLGSIEPGALMHLFAKAFNIPSEENFEKLIILGKLRDMQTDNLDRLVIIDLAQAFGTDKKNIATVHAPIQNISPEKIAELDRRLDDAIARKKQQLNTDHLNNNQIHEVINEVLEEMTQNNQPEINVQEETPSTDPTIQLSETATKCASMEDAVDDLLNIMPISNPQRSKGETHKNEEQHEDDKEDYEEDIKNPPVIQDNLNLVGKTEDGWIDDNEEARPSEENNVPSFDTIVEDTENNEVNPTDHLVGDASKEEEIFTVSGDKKPRLESDNQVNTPAEGIQERINVGTNQETEDEKKENNLMASPSTEEQNNNAAFTEEVLSAAPEERRENDLIENPSSSARDELEKNIIKLVEDSLKTVSNSDLLENSSQNQELLSPNGPIVEEEIPRPVFVKNNEETKPSQANADNTVKVVEFPKITSEPRQSQDNEILEELNEFQSPQSDTFENKPVAMENPDSAHSDLIEMAPNFENRDQFSDESGSDEKLSNFGSLIPVNEAEENSDTKKLYFVGKDIQLPLKMVQDKDGVMRLRVDMDKLCHCKNKNCTKKHVDTQEVKEKITINNVRDNEAEENTVLPEINVRFGRDIQHTEELLKSLEDAMVSDYKNSEIFKRSPIDYKYVDHTAVDDEDFNKKSDKLQELKIEEDKLENKIQKLAKSIEKYDVRNSNLLNKGNVALFKEVEKTKDVGRMITLASNMLSWMNDFAIKNLNSS